MKCIENSKIPIKKRGLRTARLTKTQDFIYNKVKKDYIQINQAKKLVENFPKKILFEKFVFHI
uniref:Uncharacterized protein n=1 Tax=Arundo donax TaxID=35708 RepID=A0A0A9CR96_ARUDO